MIVGRGDMGKEEIVLSLFTDGIIISVEMFKESTRKLLELTNGWKKGAGRQLIYNL